MFIGASEELKSPSVVLIVLLMVMATSTGPPALPQHPKTHSNSFQCLRL